MTLPKGFRLKEFEIKGVLGKGGFGITYLVEDTNLKKEMAIKEFFPRELVDRDEDSNSVSLERIEKTYSGEKREVYIKRYRHFLKKFETEAQIMASIDHPNIVKVIRYFEHNNTGYFVMNYIKGESLKEYVSKVGRLTQEQVMEIVVPILEGLKAVHNSNFLHRDIAPDNIFLTQKGKPMLLDFGAAKNTLLDSGGESSIGVVKKGYSAPEQYSDGSIHTVSTDIYSMGAVIVFMISGKMPPEATKRLTIISNEKEDPLEELLDRYSATYTQGFIKAILKSMSLQEKQRFQEVSEFQKALITERISLKSYIKKSKKSLTQKEIIEIINPLLDILERLHTENKAHGNISSESIYIKGKYSIELGASMDIVNSGSNSLTTFRNIGYSAPEQYSMDSEDTQVTDIYSVGAVILFMITKKIPTEAIKRQTDIYNGKEDMLKNRLNKYRDGYSDKFLEIISKAMELNPNNRFQDIITFKNELNKDNYPPLTAKTIPADNFIKKIVLSVLVLLFVGIGICVSLKKCGGDKKITKIKNTISKQSRIDVSINWNNKIYQGKRLYNLNSDNTIKDDYTGLIWQQKGSDKEVNWSEAKRYCDNLILDNYANWRLPLIKELFYLGDISENRPAIDTNYFDIKNTWYWSSTTFKGEINKAWNLNFSTYIELISDKDDKKNVLCVHK